MGRQPLISDKTDEVKILPSGKNPGEIYNNGSYVEVYEETNPQEAQSVVDLIYGKTTEVANAIGVDIANLNLGFTVAIEIPNSRGYACVKVYPVTYEEQQDTFLREIEYEISTIHGNYSIRAYILYYPVVGRPGYYNILPGFFMQLGDPNINLQVWPDETRYYGNDRDKLQRKGSPIEIARGIMSEVRGQTVDSYNEVYGDLSDEDLLRQYYQEVEGRSDSVFLDQTQGVVLIKLGEDYSSKHGRQVSIVSEVSFKTALANAKKHFSEDIREESLFFLAEKLMNAKRRRKEKKLAKLETKK